jgi:hypothetical protein
MQDSATGDVLMKNHLKIQAIVAAATLSCTAALAQTTVQNEVRTEAGVISAPPDVINGQAAAGAQAAISAPATVSTATAGEFLSSLAQKFGTSVSQLQALLAKLPPRGPGLSRMELWAIGSKLKLSADEKAALKAKAGPGGTGFNSEDLAGMGARLGLSTLEVQRLSQELGLGVPAIASPGTAQPAAGQPGVMVPVMEGAAGTTHM